MHYSATPGRQSRDTVDAWRRSPLQLTFSPFGRGPMRRVLVMRFSTYTHARKTAFRGGGDTTLNASTAAHGLMPKGDGNASHFYNGALNQVAPLPTA
jgi:hypothetical protein